jgi:hypothetical protein
MPVVGIDISNVCLYSTVLMKARQPATIFEIRRASAKERVVAALIAASIVAFFATLWSLQKVNFDFGLVFNPCGFRTNTGLPCPGCGMTTSVLAFARGRIWLSFYTQPASAFGCLMLVVIAVLASLIAVVGLYFKALDRFFEEVRPSHLAVGVLIVIAAGWAVTLARTLAKF